MIKCTQNVLAHFYFFLRKYVYVMNILLIFQGHTTTLNLKIRLHKNTLVQFSKNRFISKSKSQCLLLGRQQQYYVFYVFFAILMTLKIFS